MRLTIRSSCAFAIAALVVAASSAAHAADYPSQTIKIVVPFTPGGGVDVVARVIAPRLGELLGQSVIIENRGGAGGSIGATFVAQAPPDGYTLLMGTASTHGTNPNVYTKLGYDPVRDFAPVALITSASLMLVANNDVPVKTAADLVALAKAKPGTIPFASTGIGSPPHLAQELLDASAGVQFLHVPYRGAAPALTDLLGGQVEVLAADVPVLIAQIRADTVVPIGAAADKRDAILPHVPTLAEQGFPNTDASNWYGLLAPAKTPASVIVRINGAVNAALNDPDTRNKLTQSGATPVGGTPDSFGTFMKAEYEKWGRVVKERNIKEAQ
jgi:tripartite-type tricarboxylate transporter receptor subunit TctC